MPPSSRRNLPRPRHQSHSLVARHAWLAGGVLLLVVASPLALATSPGTTWESAPQSWSNGLVLCEFAPALASAGISALARAGTGLSTAVEWVAEVTPPGVPVASSNLALTAWSATNLSTESAYDLHYAVQAPVTSSTSSSTVLGTVDVQADFVLPMYAGSAESPNDTVVLETLVSNWPWQESTDHLVLGLMAWPSYAAQERLVFGGSPSSLVTGVSSSSGTAFEQMAASTQAVANPGSASPLTVSAAPTATGNSSLAKVSVAIGSAAGTFSTLSYSTSVRVLFPATVAGIPTIDLIAVAAAAGLVTILVATLARRVRSRPSDLTYADEEDL